MPLPTIHNQVHADSSSTSISVSNTAQPNGAVFVCIFGCDTYNDSSCYPNNSLSYPSSAQTSDLGSGTLADVNGRAVWRSWLVLSAPGSAQTVSDSITNPNSRGFTMFCVNFDHTVGYACEAANNDTRDDNGYQSIGLSPSTGTKDLCAYIISASNHSFSSQSGTQYSNQLYYQAAAAGTTTVWAQSSGNNGPEFISAVLVKYSSMGSQIIIIQYKKLIDDIKRGLLAPQELMRRYRQMNQKLGLLPI